MNLKVKSVVAALLVGVTMSSAVVVTADAQNSAARGAKKLTLEERVRRMEDVEAIRELMIAYGRYFDSRNFEAYGNLFARNGVWIGGTGGAQSYEGPAAIRAMVEKGYPPTVNPGSYHIMSSFNITLDGPDSAKAWSRWAYVVHGQHNEPVLFRGGQYEDEFVREDGAWKFKSRRVSADTPTAGR